MIQKETTGMILRKLRGDRTQEEIAAILGITKSSWAMYERDERVPRDEVKIRIANFLVRRCRSFFIPRLSTISAHKKGRTSMNEVSLKPVIEELENLFSKFNARFFADKLEKPVITVSPDHTRGAYGWCTGWKAWKAGEDEGHYEINLCAEYLNRPFEETCGTLIHEMVHLQNLQDGVQDTSRSGTYHNKKFKETAEAHGLTVEKGEKYGWHKTALSPEALEFVQSLGKQGFTLVRPRPIGLKGSSKGGGSSSRKYVCPCCGAIIRATKEVHVICADCDCEFQEEI